MHGEFATLAFLPYDLPWAARRFVAHFRLRLGILLETELWPNFLRECRRAGVSVLLAKARLAEKSAHGYRRVGPAREALAEAIAAGAAVQVADAHALAREAGRTMAIVERLLQAHPLSAVGTPRERAGNHRVSGAASDRRFAARSSHLTKL